MGGGEAGDWDAVGRAGDVVEADRVAELHGARLAAMLPADAHLQLRADAPTGRYGKSNQLANPVPVKHLERIVGKYTTIYVIGKESAGVVAAEAEGRLRQIIGSKRKELGLRCDLVRGQRRARQLDHRSDGVGDVLAHSAEHLLGDLLEDGALVLELCQRRRPAES